MPRERIGPGGLAGLQNRDGGAFGDSGGFDSHTLPPPRRAGRRRGLLAALLGLMTVAPAAAAQDTTAVSPTVTIIQPPPPPPPPVAAPRADLRPVTPMGAFFRSLLVPGWAQAKLDRRLTASLFMAWEGIALGMTLKAGVELGHLEAEGTDSLRIEAKKREQQDWIALLAFNHLFAGLEGFVGSHLWDFPGDLRFQALPHGAGLGLRFPIRLP